MTQAKYKQLIEMHYLGGVPISVIADVLHLSESTVRYTITKTWEDGGRDEVVREALAKMHAQTDAA